MSVTVAQHSATGVVRITVESDMPGVQFLHWGIVPWGPFGDNHWQPPPEELRPPVRGQCVGKSQNDESFTQLTSFCCLPPMISCPVPYDLLLPTTR